MKKLLNLLKAIYYYLESSYKIWKVRRLQEDDLVYTTKANVQIGVYPGRKPDVITTLDNSVFTAHFVCPNS